MKLTALAFVAITACAAAPAIAGPLDGATVHTEYLFDNAGSVYQDFGDATVVGDTVLASGLGSVDGADLHATGSNLTAIFTGDDNNFWSNADFNGFVVFDDTNSAGAITSVSINGATNMAGFDISRVTFDADHIFVNWQGLSFANGTEVSLDINGAAVPEPASWAMMLGGFGLVGGAMRNRRKAAVSFA